MIETKHRQPYKENIKDKNRKTQKNQQQTKNKKRKIV
jgi:hypothetical protein